MEKKFDELIKYFSVYKIWWANAPSPQKIDKNFESELINFGKQVRKATIAEAVNYCVSQDWVKTIYNLKRMPTDRIIDFENLPTDIIKT